MNFWFLRIIQIFGPEIYTKVYNIVNDTKSAQPIQPKPQSNSNSLVGMDKKK